MCRMYTIDDVVSVGLKQARITLTNVTVGLLESTIYETSIEEWAAIVVEASEMLARKVERPDLPDLLALELDRAGHHPPTSESLLPK